MATAVDRAGFDEELILHWEGLAASVQRDALGLARSEIDRVFRFAGKKADPTQPGRWPRIATVDSEVRQIDADPLVIGEAIAFLSKCLAAGHKLSRLPVLLRMLVILTPLLDPDRPFRRSIADGL